MRLVAHARFRACASPPRHFLLLLAAAGAGLSLQPSASHASDESWATVEINRGLSERAREGGERPRHRNSIERDVEDDDVRPQRRSTVRRQANQRPRRGNQVASLAPMAAPDPARQSSAGETPRPQAKAKQPKNPLGNMVASLGREVMVPPVKELPSLFGGPIRWVAKSECLAKPLQGVLSQIAALFGALQVNSTCRSPSHNRKVGGARRSQHLTGSAVDFRMQTATAGDVLRFVKANKTVGGYKHYGRGLFHIDTGPRRTW